MATSSSTGGGGKFGLRFRFRPLKFVTSPGLMTSLGLFPPSTVISFIKGNKLTDITLAVVGGEYVVVDAVVVVVGGGRVGASVSGSGAPHVSSERESDHFFS